MGANDLVRWPIAEFPRGWVFRPGLSKAHFGLAVGPGWYDVVCRAEFSISGPYAADVEFPRCLNCMRVLNSKPFLVDETVMELWTGCEASTRKHFFRFEHGHWKSACGVVRTRDQFVDGTGVELCRKCVAYLGENDASQ